MFCKFFRLTDLMLFSQVRDSANPGKYPNVSFTLTFVFRFSMNKPYSLVLKVPKRDSIPERLRGERQRVLRLLQEH